jgi:DNA-binding NarL/FixJ family response regulator
LIRFSDHRQAKWFAIGETKHQLDRVKKQPGLPPLTPKSLPSAKAGSPVTDLITTAPVRTPVKSLLICDDRPAAREVLTRQLTAGSSRTAIRAVADGHAVVNALQTRPTDLVLIGVHRGTPNGIQAVTLVLGAHPGAPVVVFGIPSDSTLLLTAVSHGIRGIMLWDINHPFRSTSGVLPQEGRRAGNSNRVQERLTERELQILVGMSRGHSNAQIGRHLFLSEDTVKTHARRMFDKLDARDRAHAVALGLRNGLIT